MDKKARKTDKGKYMELAVTVEFPGVLK